MKADSGYQQCSGQFRLRLPRDLHAALVREAGSQKVSLNSYVLYLLSTRHSQEKVWQEAADSYVRRLENTVREVHDAVSSITLGEPETENLRWVGSGVGDVMIQ